MNLLISSLMRYHHYVNAKKLIEKGIKIPFIITDLEKNNFYLDKNIFDIERDKAFQNTKLINRFNLFYPDKIKEINKNNDECLSKGLIDEFSFVQNQILRNSDRWTFYKLNVRNRNRIYYELLLYFYDFFKKNENRIDVILFQQIPHSAADSIVYHMAKKFKKKTIIVEITLINNRSIIIDEFDKFYEIPDSYLEMFSKEELINTIDTELYDEIFENEKYNSEILDLVKKRDTKMSICANQGNKIKKLYFISCKYFYKVFKRNGILYIIKKMLFYPIQHIYNYYTIKRYIPALVNNNIRKVYKKKKAVKYYRQHMKELYDYYNKLSVKIDYLKNYVFYALHYQPEKTSSPMCDIFEDQLLAIDIISKSIPNNWILYVKEHPAQFNSNRIINLNYRNGEFYDYINKKRNVKLVNMNENYNKAIDSSKINATLAGSIGWESLLMGKPVLVFGVSWYSACKSCFKVSSKAECMKAIELIQNKTEEDVLLDLLRYLSYYQKYLVKALWPIGFKSKIPVEEQIENYANAVVKKIQGKI